MIATKLDRFLANLIDSMVVNAMCLTLIGIPLALVYVFLKDSLEFLNFQSLGKKAMKIKVVTNDSSQRNISASQGFKRNILLAIPIYGMIEILIFLFSDNTGQRKGDEFADTIVIKVNESISVAESNYIVKESNQPSDMDNESDEIKKLAKLKDDGYITEEEYNKKKSKILNI